ncbi:MAG: hypothetical protein CVV17_04065 [Gammaproteobacteria bacterium HGW-Gammaproteobacteria-7]|nr:MAG: hypothetical protein CVV17_04065 [Gammaproteobacteria bacterium HGW-Gammaproteobacteria-7]
MMLFSRFPLLAAAVSAIASAPAAAAPAASPELTVYSGDYEALSGHGAGGYALVRDLLRRPLEAGGNTVKADNLPRALDVASVSLQAPDGWSLSATAPWLIHSNGVCEPGELMLRRDDREVPIVVHAPFCQPRRPALDDGGPGP